MASATIEWLLTCSEPWTRYRTLCDLCDRAPGDPDVQGARAQMLSHPQVRALIARAATWPGYAIKRHSDAGHPLYAISTLADMGLCAADPGMGAVVEAVLAHQAPEGPFQCLSNVPAAFGGTGEDMWTWMACDAPTLLYALLAMGLGDDPRVQAATEHLIDLVRETGWPCSASPDLGRFKGPGRREDPCPIANVYALKALSLLATQASERAARAGTEMLLRHWACQTERKLFLFGIGTDYRKLKYPFVWYNVLHVVDVLSRFPFVRGDPRLKEMVEAITVQAGPEERYTATSMYVAWRGWSFADKRRPSPWLTFLVLRSLERVASATEERQT